MASSELLCKNRGVVRASVTQTITLLTDKLQASVLDASQIDFYVAYLNQKNTELVTLNKELFYATDDDDYAEQLEITQEYDRRVSYMPCHERVSSSERPQSRQQ